MCSRNTCTVQYNEGLVLVLRSQLVPAGVPAALLAQEGRSGRAAPVPEMSARRRCPVALGDELKWRAESSLTVLRRVR